MSFIMKDQKCLQVVVFQDRAEVKRLINTKLKEGENELIITGVSNYAEDDSIRVEGSGDASILDVVCLNELVETKDITSNEKAKKMLEEIKEFESEIDKLNAKSARFEKQRSTLNEFALNLAKPKDAESESVQKFYAFLDSYTSRLEYLDTESVSIDKERTQLQDKLDVVQNNYDKLTNDQWKHNEKKEVKILVNSKADDTEINLTISYIVYRASWSPKYDIRAFGKDKKLIINYYGMIKQSTGEDWTDTKIFLSTAMPSVGGNVPEIFTENVGVKPKYTRPLMAKSIAFNAMPARSFKKKSQMSSNMSIQDECEDLCYSAMPMEEMVAEVVAIPEIGSSSTFEIPRVATIPSDNDAHKVSIGIINLQPEFEYESVPRKANHAFIKAKVINDSQYAMLAGPANVFLDNNFVAKTEIKSYSPQEEFSCSLGVDPGVRITYKPVKKYKTQTGMLSKYSLTTFEQVIEVKNTTANSIKILVKDSIPLSNDEKIQVKLIEPVTKNSSKFVLNKQNILECNLQLDKGKSEDILIKYTIEHSNSDVLDFY